MSRFTQGTPAVEEPIEKIEIDGSFLCQQCGKTVDSAFYLPEPQMLVWKCEDEHKSYIEKFVL